MICALCGDSRSSASGTPLEVPKTTQFGALGPLSSSRNSNTPPGSTAGEMSSSSGIRWRDLQGCRLQVTGKGGRVATVAPARGWGGDALEARGAGRSYRGPSGG